MRSLLSIVVLFGIGATCTWAQTTVDYSVLSQPVYANKLNLTDEQRAEVSRILDQRIADLVVAAVGDREKIVAESDAKLAALLSEEQQQTLSTAVQSGKLQFNFHGQKWSAVLEWFAKQAGLSLVINNEPAGLFTYSDTNEYTPTQAIDLLNSVLLSKNFTLIRRERMLILADTSQGIPYDIVPQIEVEQLAERGRFEIVTVAFPLGRRPVATVVEEVTPLVGQHGQVTPMAAAKTLLITETAGKLQAINVLIASIAEPATAPKIKPPTPVFATYPAPGLEPTATIETLRALFPTAQLQFDPNAEEVHSNATPSIQEGVKASLEKMIANISGDREVRLQTYDVGKEAVDDLVIQLGLVHAGLQVQADADNGRLLVVANEQGQADVQDTLNKLGVLAAQEHEGDAASIVIHQVDDDLTESLSSLLEEVIPRATVISQPGRIAVRGIESEQSLAKSTIDQFSEDPSRQRTLKIYPVTEQQKSRLSTLIDDLGDPISSMELITDADPKEIAAWGTAKQHSLLGQLLEQLKQVTRPVVAEAKQLPVTVADPSELLRLLRERFPETEMILNEESMTLYVWADEGRFDAIGLEHERLSAALSPSVTTSLETYEVDPMESTAIQEIVESLVPTAIVSVDAGGGRLIVMASEDDHKKVSAAVEKLSGQAIASKPVLIAYPLQQGDAEAVVQLLSSIQPGWKVVADTRSNRVLASAPLVEQPRIQALIAELDADTDTMTETTVAAYPFRTLNPATVVKMLQPLFPDIALTVDSENRQLVASGTGLDHQKLSAAIERVDGRDGAVKTRVAAYDLGEATAREVQNVLMQLVPTAVISTSTEANRIFVWADEESHEAIGQAVEELTAVGEKGPYSLKTYPLPLRIGPTGLRVFQSMGRTASFSVDDARKNLIAWATAKDHQTIQEALAELGKEVSRKPDQVLRIYGEKPEVVELATTVLDEVTPGVRLVESAAEDRLIVWASPEDHAVIEGFLETIRKEILSAANGQSVVVYGLELADPKIIAAAVAEVAPDATVVADPGSNSLIVTGSDESHATIADVIKQLDVASGKEEVLQAYPIRNGDPLAISRALTLAFYRNSEYTITYQSANKTVFVSATSRHQAIFAEMFASLDVPAIKKELKVYGLELADSKIVAAAVAEVAPDATVVADPGSNSLLVTGSDESHATIADVIKQLDVASGKEEVLQAYPIRNGDPLAISRALTLAFYRNSEYTITYQSANKTVFVSATPRHQAIFAEMFESLDVPEPQQELKVYPLKLADPKIVSRAVADVAPDATVAADTGSNSLLVTGTEEVHAVIEEVIQQLDVASGQEPVVQAYPIRHGDPAAIYESISLAFYRNTDYSITFQDASKTLFVIAAPRHQVIFAEMFASLDVPESKKELRVYPLKLADPRIVASAVEDVAVGATVAADTGSNSLLVTAGEETHAAIADVVKQLDVASGKEPVVQAYPIRHGDPAAIYQSVSQAFSRSRDFSITFQDANNTLYVIATPRHQVTFAQMLESLDVADSGKEMKVYPLILADPETVSDAVADLVPTAMVAADTGSNSLLVTGSSDTHATIAAVVKQLDVASGQDPVMKAYPIRQGDPDAISESLISAFARSRDYSITYQEANETVYVLATPRHQVAIEDMLMAMDQPPPKRSSQQSKLYPLANVSADVAASTIVSITEGQVPSPDVVPSEESNSLVVVATEEQHQLIQETLKQLDGDDRKLEVFQLHFSDPMTIELAVSELFAGLQGPSEPFVSTDYGTNKLFVRGTEGQLNQIRQLLVQLGESVGGSVQQLGSGKTRQIPFPGDTRAAVSQIEAIWPRIRQNKIQVIVPSEGGATLRIPGGVPPKPSDADVDQKQDASGAERDDTAAVSPSARQLVVFQNTTRATVPQGSTEVSTDPADEEAQNLPPILIMPGSDRITISSDDSEALDRLESLLRAMSQAGSGIGGQANFSVFLLRNTGAIEIEVLLKRLFDEMPFPRGGIGDAVVVSDERLNALIIHGNPRTRDMVAELLEVLDTNELPNPLNVYRPEMISLENTQASRVIDILRNVYKTQMSTVGGRSPFRIPKGVASSVASVLQQMNAAASGPLLTLDVDENTNTLIVRAPPELRDEIREFVEQIDKQAATQSNRHVRVIQLRQSKSDQMLSVLQQFLSTK